jgi:hypothetical protein
MKIDISNWTMEKFRQQCIDNGCNNCKCEIFETPLPCDWLLTPDEVDEFLKISGRGKKNV